MALQNPDPRDNPLAIEISLDTIINGVTLDPKEAFSVIGPMYAGGVSPLATNDGLDKFKLNPKDSSIKMIPLVNVKSYYYSIYMPAPGRESAIYLVPTRYNDSYEGSYQDFTESSQLDNVDFTETSFTWRGAAANWITKMLGAVAVGPGKLLQKRLVFTGLGMDTNLTEKSTSFEIILKHTT